MSLTNKEIKQLSFTIILHAGNARSSAMEAITSAKQFDFDVARDKITESKEELTLAHKEQTTLLQEEAAGEETNLSIILIHAQDHLMSAITVKDLANEMIEMYEKIQHLEATI
ncbi:MAG TPA: PTS lactose/cellobiose transporter subunit IIA [Pseudogracilibacillus sp.]|nr:PTS lactose/cellobiose transporter subunit IIA [Pseudogracilibacillus sp.]